MNYSKYVVTFFESIIAGVCLDIAFEEIHSQMAVILMVIFAIVGIGGEIIADILEKKTKRREAEQEQKNREEFFLKLEETMNKSSKEALEQTDRILEILNVHTFNFEEYLNFHVNHQKSLESKVSELIKIVKNMDASIVEEKTELQKELGQIIEELVVEREKLKKSAAEIKEELEKNTQAVKESGKQILDTENKLLEKIEPVVEGTISVKECCADIFVSEKQIIEEIAGRSSLLSEQCSEIKKQIEKEAELLRELKPILDQAEELKNKCDEMIRLENQLASKLGVAVNNSTTEISTVVNSNGRAFLGRIHSAMNKKGER